MYLVHLVLTRAGCPAPTEADAQRIRDGLGVQVLGDLDIEHVRARAGPGRIDVVVFFRSSIQGSEPADPHAALTAIRNLPLLHGWRVILGHGENDGMPG